MALGGPPATSQVVRNGAGDSGGAGPLVPSPPITAWGGDGFAVNSLGAVTGLLLTAWRR